MSNPATPRPARTRLIIAAVVALVGIVWIVQGLGTPIAGTSLMNGNPFWAFVGVALIIVAGVYAAWPRMRRR